jgi:hypothetical protein
MAAPVFMLWKNGTHKQIAIIFNNERRTVYYLDNKAYYEDEILKVLKLKAFL